jgi:hypothetical protein
MKMIFKKFALQGIFSKTVFKNSFQKETLQGLQPRHGLIEEYHPEVIIGLTFPREMKE